MTDKERLEELEIKYSTLTISREKNSTEYTEVDVEDLVFLIQNSFKQAERMQELEGEVFELKARLEGAHKYNDVMKMIADDYDKQNKRYRKILSYVREIDCIDWNKEELAEMARKALEGEE